MIGSIAIAVAAIVATAGLTYALTRRNRQGVDDIASFRRQIDALSPEARRQTSDRMKPSESAPTSDDGGDER